MISNVCSVCKDTECIREGTLACLKCGFIPGKEALPTQSVSKGTECIGTNALTQPEEGKNSPQCKREMRETEALAASEDMKKPNTDAPDKALLSVYTAITNICLQLSLSPDVEEQARALFESIRYKIFLRNIHAKVAAIVFIVCRRLNQPLSMQEIGAVLNCEPKAVSKSYTTLRKLFPQTESFKSPIQYAIRYATILGYSQEMKRKVQVVAERVMEQGVLDGKNPKSIAGVVIYFVGMMDPQRKMTFEEVAKAVGITEVTLKTTFREIAQYSREYEALLSPF
jgi:transcription initiation factor TFIIIB Brf1 subunit/transcription initiation factor TFIIB